MGWMASMPAACGDVWRWFDQWWMLTKTHVNNIFSVYQCLVHEGANEVTVVVYRIDFQNDIVTDPEAVKNFIHPCIAGGNSI